MKHLYGEFTNSQINETVDSLRKSVFFLLICADPNTKQEIIDEYGDINLQDNFNGLLLKLGGMNHLLMYPSTLVTVMSLLQAALDEYTSAEYNFRTYRKLILDAGAELSKLKEG